MAVQGHCDPRFDNVREVFAEHLKTGAELGASVCVSINGETVIDLWGGYTSAERTQPWARDTIAPVWSVSKTITALATLLLIDRGQVHPDDAVAKYWPAFDTPDKRGILVRHFLSHTSGLPSWDPPIDAMELFANTALATEKLVAQEPWWEPGTASGYHLISQGLLLGELVHRISGKPLSQFIADELATPLNADFHLGLQDESQWGRIAIMDPPPPFPAGLLDEPPQPNNPMYIALRAMRGTRGVDGAVSSTPEFRRCGIGSIGGLSNARGFNKILEIITNRGTVNGKQFLKPETVDLIFQTQAEGIDLVLGTPLKIGMGFGLSKGTPDWVPTGKVCFWGGWGGSIAIMDLERGVTVTYAMNKMENGTLGNSNAVVYTRAVYEVIWKEGIRRANANAVM
ncbi:beta-lactamase/transpeptidase-like protein [Aspergillus desertorum]